MTPPVAVRDTSFNDLDDGAVGEVLINLPSQASLAVALAVCKPWLSICTSPAFLHRYHRRHTGATILGLLHSTGHIYELGMIRDDGANSRPDLAVTLRNMDRGVKELRRYRRYLNLWILDYHGGRFLLKSLEYNMLFVYDLLTGQHNELRWPPQEVFCEHMIGFIMYSGNIVFVQKPVYSPSQTPSDHCYVYSADVKEWKKVMPFCQEADAARYAVCTHDIVWKQRAGDVVYSMCGYFAVDYCLAALDMRSMSYSIIDLPRCLQHSELIPFMKIMEMGCPESIGLVSILDEPKFTVRAWLRLGEGNVVTTAGGAQEWTAYNPMKLQGLASKLAIKIKMAQVVAAYDGVVHLGLIVSAKEHMQDNSYFASLDLSSKQFTDVHPVESGWNDKIYPFSLPWRPPFLPPPADNVEANN